MSDHFKGWQDGHLPPPEIGVWQAWTPTFTGFSSNPTGRFRYCLIGKLCFCVAFMSGAGTSNANVFELTAPFTSSNSAASAYFSVPFAVNGGTNYYEGEVMGVISHNHNKFRLTFKTGYTSWITSGAKRAYFTAFYEVA